MIEEVTHYQTKDGVLHDSEERAQEHISDQLANLVGPIIDKTNIGFVARLNVVKALVGTPQLALELKTLLGKFV